MTTTLKDAIEKQNKDSILQAPTKKSTASTAATGSLSVALVNTTSSSNCYAYVTGLDPSQNNAVFLLQADGVTGYYPSSPSSPITPLAVNCAIPLGAPGSTVNITVPYLNAARLWFCLDAQLTFYVNPGPALVEPSVTNPSDPNYNLTWSFIEFTYSAAQLFANISYVDFVSMPISLALENTSGVTQSVQGIPADGLSQVVSGLQQQDASDNAGWSNLIIKDSSGSVIRALSPNNGIVMNNSLFSGYYQPYVNQVWSQYSTSTLTVDTQGSWGSVTGEVSNNQLTFSGVATYSQPAAADIFSCSSGPFAITGITEVDNISARLAAAFNRSTLLIDSDQPDGEVIADYYQTTITNHYARIVHSVIPDGKGYAFPYDDVEPNSNSSVAGTVSDPNPQLFTVTFGGISSNSTNNNTRRTRVPVGQIARSGGAHRQYIGGRGNHRLLRRSDQALLAPPSADDEKAALVARDEQAELAADLERGLTKLQTETPAAPRRDAIPAAVAALLRRVPAARRVAPVLEAVARAAVDVLRVSVGTVVGRAVVVAILVLASFILGLFWPGGEQVVRAHAGSVV